MLCTGAGDFAYALARLSMNARAPLIAQPGIGAVPETQVLALVDAHALAGSGIGWGHAQVLATALANGLPLWTLDRMLADAAGRLHCRFEAPQ